MSKYGPLWYSVYDSFPFTKRVPDFTTLASICTLAPYERSSVWIMTVSFKVCNKQVLILGVKCLRWVPNYHINCVSFVFQFFIILSSAYCVLWFFLKPVRNLETFVTTNSFSWLYITQKTFPKFDKMLTGL